MKTIKHVLSRMAIGLVLFGMILGLVFLFGAFIEILLGLIVVFLVLFLVYVIGWSVLDD